MIAGQVFLLPMGNINHAFPAGAAIAVPLSTPYGKHKLESSGFSEVFRVDDRKWPAGEVFAGKLLTYGCRRNSDGPGKTPGAGHSAGPRADPLPPE